MWGDNTLTALVQVLVLRRLEKVSIVLRPDVLFVFSMLGLNVTDPESGNGNYTQIYKQVIEIYERKGRTTRQTDIETREVIN